METFRLISFAASSMVISRGPFSSGSLSTSICSNAITLSKIISRYNGTSSKVIFPISPVIDDSSCLFKRRFFIELQSQKEDLIYPVGLYLFSSSFLQVVTDESLSNLGTTFRKISSGLKRLFLIGQHN